MTNQKMNTENNDKTQIIVENSKPKRRRLRVGDPDFKPPDGGWGWLVVVACGFSNLSTFPVLQQFGLIFRDKFKYLEITNAQMTTVINANSALNSCVGLMDGPLFRYFSYRKIAIIGSVLVTLSVFLLIYCQSFWAYLFVYSICYGCALGFAQSANYLALNVYFKEKRRLATGLSWTTTAFGPIVWPYIITVSLDYYGMDGTVLIFAAIASHSIMCSLLLQPVEWHTEFMERQNEIIGITEKDDVLSDKYMNGSLSKEDLNENEKRSSGYSNEGYASNYGSKISLNNDEAKRSNYNSLPVSKRSSYIDIEDRTKKGMSCMELDKKVAVGQYKSFGDEQENKLNNNDLKSNIKLTDMKNAVNLATQKLSDNKKAKEKLGNVENSEEEAIYKEGTTKKKLTIFQRVAKFFDFDLLKDAVYVNLMMGITIANFAEINFSILTPMVLQEFNFNNYEIATFMSLLAACDIVVRFLASFVSDKIGWDNKTFFLIGVLSMAFGRIILVHTQTYNWGLVVAVIIGAGKGLRTIFVALVIPSHVPLQKLPAASGIQLAFSGFIFTVFGPVVGWIRDLVNNYVVTLHLLNVMTYTTAIAWIIEEIISRRKRSSNQKQEIELEMKP